MSHGPASFSNPDAKEQVRQATDIVELVGGYLQLRRQGRGYVGLCPWHDDSKPSLQVNPERQTFKCWVCDIGGDVFSFLMRMDGLEFREALEALAERAGIELQPARSAPIEPGSPGDKKTLLAAAAWAEEQFARCLHSDPAAEPARRYLQERGITGESVGRFRLGFAPDRWDWLLGKSRDTRYSPAVLERIGLVRPRQQGGGHYDFYRGRVIFPIHDVRSRTIAFGGRVLPEFSEGAGGKYINSPETPLFSKSNQLYALNLARDAIASEGRVVVTEGYTDVIMAHQNGVENVVAVLGTALGAQHLPLIRRFTDSIVLVLDGDEAGQRRTNEVLEIFVANNADLRILGLPEGLDPCDFIATPNYDGEPKEGSPRERGPEAFRHLVAQAPDALEHKLLAVTKGLGANIDTHTATRAVEEVLATLAKAGAPSSENLLREQGILGRLARRFQLPEEGLRSRLTSLRRAAAKPTSTADAPAEYAGEPSLPSRISELPPLERELLELLLNDNECARRILETVSSEELSSEVSRRVLQMAADALEIDGEVRFHKLLDAASALPDAERLKSLLVQLDDAREAKSDSVAQQRIDDLVAAIERRRDDARRRDAVASLRTGRLETHEEEEVLGELFAKLKHRQTGPLATDG